MQVGAFGTALELLATAEDQWSGPLDEFQRARADLLRAHVTFASGAGLRCSRAVASSAYTAVWDDESIHP
jgi:hypothetical protein